MTLDKIKTQEFLRRYTMIIALGVIWLLFGALSAVKTGGRWVFLSPRNISNLFRQATITGFLATGMLLVIVTAGIDLSVGSVTGFISVITAWLQVRLFPDLLVNALPNATVMQRGVVSTVVTIIVALLVGVGVGAIQGSVISYLRVPAFIVTLGGQLIFRGGVIGVTGGLTLVPIEDSLRQIAQGYFPPLVGWVITIIVVVLIFLAILSGRSKKSSYGFEVPPMAMDLGKASVFSLIVIAYTFIMNKYRGIQSPVLLLAVVAMGVHYITQNTRFGRYVYALGGNKEATRLSGIDIKKNLFLVHVLMGLLTGVAGIVLTGYVAAGTPSGGVNYELDAIASCVIGGTSLAGGSGTVIGAIIGALVMTSLMNGMSVLGWPPFLQYIIKGLVLIIAVYFDTTSKKSKA